MIIAYDVALAIPAGRSLRMEKVLRRIAGRRRLRLVTIQPWELDLFRERIRSRRIRVGTVVDFPMPRAESSSGRRPLFQAARRSGARILTIAPAASPRATEAEAKALIRKARRA